MILLYYYYIIIVLYYYCIGIKRFNATMKWDYKSWFINFKRDFVFKRDFTDCEFILLNWNLQLCLEFIGSFGIYC